jgi:hypothetical protein
MKEKRLVIDQLIDFIVAGRIDDLASAAAVLSKHAEYQPAAEKLLEFLLKRTDNSHYFERLISLHAANGDLLKAGQLCDSAIAHSTFQGVAHLMRAWIEGRQNGFDAAVPFYRQASKIEGLSNAARVGSSNLLSTAEVTSILAAPRPEHPIEWLIEPVVDHQLTTYVCCDQKYFDSLFLTYSESVNLNLRSRIHVHVVNPHAEFRQYALEQFQNQPYSISCEQTRIGHTPSYTQNARFIVAGELAQRLEGPLLVTDLDFCFLPGITDLVSRMEAFDLCYVSGNHPPHRYRYPWDMFHANFIFAQGENGKNFLRLNAHLMALRLNRMENTSHLDQALLECARNYFEVSSLPLKSKAINSEVKISDFYVQATGDGNDPSEKLRRLQSMLNAGTARAS